ncbi:MATE family efflux transporter, partial [candidate division KSB3 bacterium]|nr:MATE family efflux transporter [candidate division KSB3 bacterium]MBD3324700.1 MATE family efflux transporter [candidate division KSB3 bacterium]
MLSRIFPPSIRKPSRILGGVRPRLDPITSDDRSFYSTLFKISIPITIQHLVMASLNLIDTIMIGQLGAVEVAAVGLANRFYFIFVLITFALGSGAAVFTAQFWGKRDIEHIGKPMAIALLFSFLVGLYFSLGALVVPEYIMAIFTTDRAVISTGKEYFQIVAFSYVLTAITVVFSLVLRSIERASLPMYVSVSAFMLNTFLNYCLILGELGFPALGVKGAAIATLIARIVEVVAIVSVSYARRYPLVTWQDILEIPPGFIRQFFAKALPVVANEFFWVMGVTTFALVYGRMGTAEIAAVNIVSPVEQISVELFFGLANAAAVMVGNQIGAGREATALAYA